GPPVVTTGTIDVQPGTNTYQVDFPVASPPQAPEASDAQLVFKGGKPVLDIEGTQLAAPTNVVVEYRDSASGHFLGRVAANVANSTATTIEVPVPNTVALGDAQVVVINQIKDTQGNVISQQESAPFFVDPGTRYAFVTEPATNKIAVIDTTQQCPL